VLDSVFNAIMLNKILYALLLYFGYLTSTFYGYDLCHLSETSQYELVHTEMSRLNGTSHIRKMCKPIRLALFISFHFIHIQQQARSPCSIIQ